MRTAPTLEKKREKSVAKQTAKRDRKAAKKASDPRVIATKIFDRWKLLKCWPKDLSRATSRFTIARTAGSRGGAYVYRNHVSIRLSPDNWAWNRMVILHELSHLAAPATECHGDLFRSIYTEAVRDLLGEFDPVKLGSVYEGLDVEVEQAFKDQLADKLASKLGGGE